MNSRTVKYRSLNRHAVPMRPRIFLLPGLSLASLLAVALVGSAHEGIEIDEYQLRTSFLVEPAYVDDPNGVVVRIQHPKEGQDHHDANATIEPFLGAEKTLNVTVSTGGREVTLPFEIQSGQPGAYVARFIPTVAGTYTFHFKGRLGDTAVDKSLEYKEPVEKRSEAEFPAEGLSNYETEQRIGRLTEEVASLKGEVAALKNLTGARGAPAASPLLLVGGLIAAAVIALLARRR